MKDENCRAAVSASPPLDEKWFAWKIYSLSTLWGLIASLALTTLPHILFIFFCCCEQTRLVVVVQLWIQSSQCNVTVQLCKCQANTWDSTFHGCENYWLILTKQMLHHSTKNDGICGNKFSINYCNTSCKQKYIDWEYYNTRSSWYFMHLILVIVSK